MPLQSGEKLGPYEVLSAIGAGGMGEVYRARDNRLNRVVAIKVLSGQLSSRPDLHERFEREARAISALQHPNICTLHDIGEKDGTSYLVLEFVEGEPLDQRIAKGRLPIDQVLRYAAEIADALDKAHRQGIVHRDLKPSNVMLTKSGAKLLDFGLAKLQEKASTLSNPATDITMATSKLTGEGMLVGTFQYMAPEQFEGKEADCRTDIFALGTLIYEMATGKAAFEGKSRASLIAAILQSEPQPISELHPMTPPALQRVVKRCLAKDPDDRWQNAGDLASELRWIAESGSQAGVPAPVVAQRKRQRWIPWLAAGIFALVAAIAGLLYLQTDRTPPRALQAYLPPPVGTDYFFSGDSAGFPVISPEGDRVAFVATDEHAARLLWIRSLLDGSVRSLPGTDGAMFPFWSPDGKQIGFFTEGQLRRVAINGGLPTDITGANSARGGSWGKDDIIIFTPGTQQAIYKVPASGGTAQQVTKVDSARHTTHRWPFFLPDGNHFLYLAASHSKPHAEFDQIFVASLDGKENRALTTSTSNAIAVPGYLLFVQGTTLMAQPFDIGSATLKGDSQALAQNVHFEEGNWHGVFDCSADGILLYQSGVGNQGSELLWYSKEGKVLSKLGDRDLYQEIRLSPDGTKLAASVGDPSGNLWVYDLARGAKTRYTFPGHNDRGPIWSPDGKQIVFTRIQDRAANLYVVDSNSAGTEKPLFSSETTKFPTSFAPDGKTLLFSEMPVGIGLSILDFSGEPKAKEFLPKVLTTSSGAFSPDGRWVAYTSAESGRTEVYVTQFPGPRGKWQISTTGGREPIWRRDGKALFYWAGNHEITEVQVSIQGEQFQVNAVQPLFKVAMPLVPMSSPTYDVTPDGKRLIVNALQSEEEQPLTLVTNWTSLVHKK